MTWAVNDRACRTGGHEHRAGESPNRGRAWLGATARWIYGGSTPAGSSVAQDIYPGNYPEHACVLIPRQAAEGLRRQGRARRLGSGEGLKIACRSGAAVSLPPSAPVARGAGQSIRC